MWGHRPYNGQSKRDILGITIEKNDKESDQAVMHAEGFKLQLTTRQSQVYCQKTRTEGNRPFDLYRPYATCCYEEILYQKIYNVLCDEISRNVASQLLSVDCSVLTQKSLNAIN